MTYEKLRIPETLESPYEEMSKEGAVAFFDWLQENAEFRINEFIHFVELTSDEKIELDLSPNSLLGLGAWLKKIARVRKRTEAEMNELTANIPEWLKESVRKKDTVLSEESFSICFDLSLYFSKVIMKSDSRIKWKMHTKASKLDADRNQLILIGLANARQNPIRAMQIVCFQMAQGRENSEALWNLFNIWMEGLSDSKKRSANNLDSQSAK